MNAQPVPDVTIDDVFRVVSRDYSPEDQQTLRAMIEDIDTRDKARVVLACLRIADGALSRATHALDNATVDARDVIAAAEYPIYLKKVERIEGLSAEELLTNP